jgi:hypothetical protein
LTDILYRTNNAGSSKDSDLNKIIALEMKEWIGIDGKMQKWNADFSTYNNHLNGLLGDADFWNEDLMDDALEWVWVTGVDMKQTVVKNLALRTWWAWTSAKSGPKVWKQIREHFHAVANQAHSGLDLHSSENKYMQRDDMKRQLRWFLAWILQIAGADERTLKYYEESDFSLLVDWWIRASKDLKRSWDADAPNIWYTEVAEGTNDHFESKLNEWVDNIIRVEQWWATLWWAENAEDHIPADVRSLFEIPEDTKTKVNDTMRSRSDNEEYA